MLAIVTFKQMNQEIFALNIEAGSLLLTAQKMKFSIKDFFSKCDQIRSLLRIWSLLLKKSLMEYFIFCAVAGHRFVLIKDTHRENAPSNKS